MVAERFSRSQSSFLARQFHGHRSPHLSSTPAVGDLPGRCRECLRLRISHAKFAEAPEYRRLQRHSGRRGFRARDTRRTATAATAIQLIAIHADGRPVFHAKADMAWVVIPTA